MYRVTAVSSRSLESAHLWIPSLAAFAVERGSFSFAASSVVVDVLGATCFCRFLQEWAGSDHSFGVTDVLTLFGDAHQL